MVFRHRKSSGRPESFQEESDVKRRINRLSKPLTNKSTTNLALLAVQDSAPRSNNASTDGLVPAPMSPKPTTMETRRDIRTHVFDGELCKDPAKPANEGAWGGVALMVSKFETANTSQQSLTPIPASKTRRPFSNMFGNRRNSGSRRPSLTTAISKDRLMAMKDDRSPSTSSVELPAVPTSRRASFQPGTATRKSSAVESLREDPHVKSPQLEPSVIEEEAVDDGMDDAKSFSSGDDEGWLPPPQIVRTETPNSLDYTHLGGLRLGSLHVTNGRVSPAASEMSRRLLARVALQRRQASSEYGSEMGDDERIYTDPHTPPIGHSREVSWYSNGSVKAHTAVFTVARKPLPQNSILSTPPKHRRDASTVAAEYISELPASPYDLQRSNSEALSQKIDAVVTTESIHSVHVEPHEWDVSRSRSSSFTTQSHRSGSPVSLMSKSGSVLRTTTKKTEFEDKLFDDETMGSSITPDRTPERRSLESIESWHSPMKPKHEYGEAFESAVEFQRHATPHGFPMRSPIKQMVSPPVLAPIASVELLQPSQEDQPVKSDSGYSSNNSVRSYSGDQGKNIQVATSTLTAITSAPPTPSKIEKPPPSAAAKFFKPILKSRKTAPAVPTFKDIRPIPQTAASVSNITKTELEKEKAKPKRLQKRNGPQKRKSLFVQRVRSVDDLSLPPVSRQMSQNLQVRTLEVPELEKTFRSMHHVRNQESMSTMDLSKLDIRFPSPAPESESGLKPPKRTNSKGRRGSWFNKSKQAESKRYSDVSERDAMAIINDFGTVASSLGGSPYDMANEKGQVNKTDPGMGKLNPHNISTKAPRPKSMYDAHTAAELARFRSSSIKERDARSERRTPFNDRGGIPGKKLRPTSMAMDAPPMPPLPRQNLHQNEDHQRYEPHRQEYHPHQHGHPHYNPQLYEYQHQAPQHQEYQVLQPQHRYQEYQHHQPQRQESQTLQSRDEFTAPPLPPKHSPRPSFIEPADYFKDQYIQEEPNAPPPPPPSHSPRPIDISPRASRRASPEPEQQKQDPWQVQAAMWRARRQSAGEALKRQSWQEGDCQPEEQAIEDEPLYPSIPERHPDANRHRFAQARHYSIQPGAHAQDFHVYSKQQFGQKGQFQAPPSQWQHHTLSQHHDYIFQTQPYQPDPYQSESRPLPPAGHRSPSKSPHSSRPTSRHSARSYASSMAEELHPENYAEHRRLQPPNDFGRYSGGLGYGYEGKDKGFGGSAGTRTVSGKADGMFKGVQLRESYGVDLGDIPVMGVLMRERN